jgi:flavodoxin I
MKQNIGLFYGTNSDNSKIVAEMIQEAFAHYTPIPVELFDIGTTGVEKMQVYENLIIGCPTWYIGQLQEDWSSSFPEIELLDLHGKRVALYGLGDQYGYPDTFVDAIGILGRQLEAAGAELVGFTTTEGFEFDYSEGLEDGVFLGLALDEDNQSELTPDRVNNWVHQLIEEFMLEEAAIALP